MKRQREYSHIKNRCISLLSQDEDECKLAILSNNVFTQEELYETIAYTNRFDLIPPNLIKSMDDMIYYFVTTRFGHNVLYEQLFNEYIPPARITPYMFDCICIYEIHECFKWFVTKRMDIAMKGKECLHTQHMGILYFLVTMGIGDKFSRSTIAKCMHPPIINSLLNYEYDHNNLLMKLYTMEERLQLAQYARTNNLEIGKID